MTDCRKCGMPLKFKTLPNGKKSPINPDGSDHWDLCKSTIRNGKPFGPETGIESSGWIMGKHFVETESVGVPWVE